MYRQHRYDNLYRGSSYMALTYFFIITYSSYSNVPINTSKCDSGILEVSISDHYAIFAIDNSTHIKANVPQVTKRSFCNKNIENFRRCLNNQS